jgi:hypothetical protein
VGIGGGGKGKVATIYRTVNGGFVEEREGAARKGQAMLGVARFI